MSKNVLTKFDNGADMAEFFLPLLREWCREDYTATTLPAVTTFCNWYIEKRGKEDDLDMETVWRDLKRVPKFGYRYSDLSDCLPDNNDSMTLGHQKEYILKHSEDIKEILDSPDRIYVALRYGEIRRITWKGSESKLRVIVGRIDIDDDTFMDDSISARVIFKVLGDVLWRKADLSVVEAFKGMDENSFIFDFDQRKYLTFNELQDIKRDKAHGLESRDLGIDVNYIKTESKFDNEDVYSIQIAHDPTIEHSFELPASLAQKALMNVLMVERFA